MKVFSKLYFSPQYVVACIIATIAMSPPAYSQDVVFESGLIGLTEAEAILKVEELGLEYDARRVPDCGIPNTVVGTIPTIGAGTSVHVNEKITLKLTTKSGLAVVPPILESTLADATITLENECFKVVPQVTTPGGKPFGKCGMGWLDFVPDGGIVDKIVKVSPGEGEQAQWTSSVTITRNKSGTYRQTRPAWSGNICP